MKKNYVNYYIGLLEEHFETAYALLSDFPFTGIEERYDEIIVTFEETNANDEEIMLVIERLKDFDPEARLNKREIVGDRNWIEEWEKNVEPIRISDKLGIAPGWKLDELDSEIKIIINPKMSFGTGSHATTRLMCRLALECVRPGSFWIDAGTGTGALAIAAIKLGAKGCYAFDNNEWSVENARENFELNGCDDVIELDDADITAMELPPSDGIFANLFIHLVVRSFTLFYNSLKGRGGDLLVSGILVYDRDEVLEAAAQAGFRLEKIISEDEWLAFHFKVDK
ncbi:MAG: 50S ribosomal protein L11 methyltransferase [Chloroflexota bacterium]